MSLLSLEKICYVACGVHRAGQLICLCASLHKHDRMGLVEKFHLKVKFNKTIINFIMAAIAH